MHWKSQHLQLLTISVQQVGLGLCDWISPLGLLGVVAWLAALLALEAVQAGRMRLPFVHMQLPTVQTQLAGDVEAGLLVSREPGTI